MASPRVLLWYGALARAKALASRRYRMLNPAEVGTNVTVWVGERVADADLDRCDALVVIRPYPTRGLDRALARCRRRGIPVIGDYDDLLFAGSPSERPEVATGRLRLAWIQDAQDAYASLLPRLDAFFVSTEELATELRAARPDARVYVVENGLSPSWVHQGRLLYPEWTPGMPRVMRFFPGSPTHDAGFDAIAPAMHTLLERHPDLSLELVGNLRWDARGFPAGRVRARRAVPFDHLPELLASSWVNLWPRVDGRFNRVKSSIKFLEAAAFGAPTIASRCCVRERITCEGLLAASTAEDWVAAVERLRDEDARHHASEAARALVSERGQAAEGWRAMRAALDELSRTRVAC